MVIPLEESALRALIAWRKRWNDFQEGGPTEGMGFDKTDVRLYKVAGKLIKARTKSEVVAPPLPVELMSKAIDDVLAERERQKSVLGWTTEHDDEHTDGSIAAAAAVYAHPSPQLYSDPRIAYPIGWPHHWDYKPKGRRLDLVRAAALIIAEIERIDRSTLETKA